MDYKINSLLNNTDFGYVLLHTQPPPATPLMLQPSEILWWICTHSPIATNYRFGLRLLDYKRRIEVDAVEAWGNLWEPGLGIERRDVFGLLKLSNTVLQVPSEKLGIF